MKKYLLCVIAMVCVSIGAWAEPEYDLEPETGTWKNGQGKVVVIKLKQTGGLKAALEKLAGEIAKPGAEGEKYKNYTMLRIESENNVVLNDDDITALNSNSVTAETIDMQNLKTNPSTSQSTPIAFDNSSVVNLILPDGWGKADVNRAAQGCSHLGAAFSMGTVSDLLINNNPAASITAYVKTPGTLHDAIDHSYYTKKKPGNQTELVDNKKLRANGVGEFYALNKLGKVTISGTPSARDYCNGTMNFDPDGHFQFDVPAIEQGADQIRTLVGTPAEGALTQAKLMILDLGDAVVLEEDLILSKTGFFNDATAKMIVIPTSSQVTTLPADFLNCDHGIHELCIPANIQYIKSRAFKGFRIDHIFTTNPDPTGNPNLKVDNGIVMSDGQTYTGYQGNIRSGADGFDDFKWGTYTLPPNLKLIETAAFGIQNQGDPKVKDLYMLSIEAPECHVDAFPPVMYQGNNTFDSSQIDAQGIITRDAYLQPLKQNKPNQYNWITMLHYPRECGTPNIQRYTDPTREYSIATGDVDGNGSPIYYPNQCEFDRAYNQGTTGYLWNAWDPTRNDNGSGTFLYTTVDAHNVFGGWSAEAQQTANGVYASNNTTPEETLKFTSFYDVTANGLYSQPNSPTQLVPYYNVYRGGGALHDKESETVTGYTQLYPAAETESVLDDNGDPVYEERPKRDANGNLIYGSAGDGATWEGNYVAYQTVEYVEDENGGFYRPMLDRNWDSNKPKPWYKKTQVQKADPNGDYIWTSTIGSQYDYTTCATWLTWGHTVEELAAKRAGGWTFSIAEKYEQDDNSGQYYLGDYTTYTGSETDFVSGISGPYKQETVTAYRLATSSDEGPFYKVDTEIVQVTRVKKANDYRGWHQFVLTGYAHNSELVFEPIKSYITDNDWWTICAPYNLRRSDLILLFGDKSKNQIPYLSKLVYVVRDVQKEKITLMFSKNLMEYMEYEIVKVNGEDVKRSINNPTDLTKPGDHVHGIVDDTPWSETDLQYDPIILHAGVPYLIKPYMSKDNGSFKRQFDIYSENQPTGTVLPQNAIQSEWLYQSFKTARSLTGTQQKTLIYNGEYQVPAFVINNSSAVESVLGDEEGEDDELTITMNDNSTFTYGANSVFEFKGGSYDMAVSSQFKYTFVGSFYKSLLPKYCYFLGWNNKQGKAAFFYNLSDNTSDYNWNNETGIICANWSLNHEITDAKSDGLTPARWESTGSGMGPDDFPSAGAKGYMDMEFGNAMDLIVVDDSMTTGVRDVTTSERNDNIVYDIHGVKIGTSVRGLAKGVYIMNGKKFVVK